MSAPPAVYDIDLGETACRDTVLSMLGACEGLALGLSPDLWLPCRGSDGGSQGYIPECAPFSFHLVWPMDQAAWEKGQLLVLHFVSFPGSGLLLPHGPLSTNPTLSRRAVHNSMEPLVLAWYTLDVGPCKAQI